MQIYIILFIHTNIFIEKFGVGPDGQDPSSGFGCLNLGMPECSGFGFALYPLGTFFQVLYLRAPIQAGIRAFINLGM